MTLAFLPGVLAALALLSLALGGPGSSAFITLQTALLVAGAVAVAWARFGRWEIQAAATAMAAMASSFQVSAALLGERGGVQFPDMALWRAAQAPRCTLVYYEQNVRAWEKGFEG